MAGVLPSDEREWLLEALRELIEARGPRTFLEARILEPSPRDFPDPFEPSKRGVRALLRRILAYAGLEGLGVELSTFSEPHRIRELDERGRAKAWGREKGTAAWFAGIEDGVCRFGVAEENIHEPAALVATLCHEVAHAWRAVHALWVDDRAVEERLTDLSTVYLGFGLLTTNGTYLYRQRGDITGGAADGSIAVTQWSHSYAGYLSPEAMSYLLAVQAKARNLGWLARRRIVAKLEPTQAALFQRAYGGLGRDGALSALGLARWS
jgi:hypothetical protein